MYNGCNQYTAIEFGFFSTCADRTIQISVQLKTAVMPEKSAFMSAFSNLKNYKTDTEKEHKTYRPPDPRAYIQQEKRNQKGFAEQ